MSLGMTVDVSRCHHTSPLQQLVPTTAITNQHFKPQHMENTHTGDDLTLIACLSNTQEGIDRP